MTIHTIRQPEQPSYPDLDESFAVTVSYWYRRRYSALATGSLLLVSHHGAASLSVAKDVFTDGYTR